MNVYPMIIIFWEMTPCGSYKNRRFGGSHRLHLKGERVRDYFHALRRLKLVACSIPGEQR
jgi:hypothetical protein